MKRFVRGAGAATSKAKRGVYFAAGLLMLLLGIIGAFLPVMPTTIFVILAAWCFGRSSPRFETWLLGHPTFGPPLRAWREEGAIPRRGKLMAWTGMAIGYCLFWLGNPGALVAVVVTSFFAFGAVYVGTRPDPKSRQVDD